MSIELILPLLFQTLWQSYCAISLFWHICYLRRGLNLLPLCNGKRRWSKKALVLWLWNWNWYHRPAHPFPDPAEVVKKLNHQISSLPTRKKPLPTPHPPPHHPTPHVHISCTSTEYFYICLRTVRIINLNHQCTTLTWLSFKRMRKPHLSHVSCGNTKMNGYKKGRVLLSLQKEHQSSQDWKGWVWN